MRAGLMRAAGVAALTLAAACAKSGPVGAPSATSTASGAVGYVRMSDLVKHHPLFSQLSAYDDSIAALNLRTAVPAVTRPDAALAKEEAALQKELDAAAARTKTLIEEKSKQYQAREQAAIAQALRASSSGPSADQIRSQIAVTARGQASTVATQAQRDLESYRKTLVAQDDAELSAAQKTLAERANRTFRAKQDELQAKEAALTLEQANKNAAQRLALRTRLSSLALDDAEREDVRTKLAALDRSEADALAAMKNRDQATLAALQTELRAGVQHDLTARVNDIHGRSLGKLRSREDDVRREFAAGPVLSTSVTNGTPQQHANPNLPPQLRTKIEALHSDYQKQFDSDAKATIADFNKTRDDLRRRFAELRGIDAGAQTGAQSEIASLTKKRDDLYGQMVAQIGREVRLIAQQRGISVVVTDPVANAGGVDLTADAMKDIESLHE